MKAFMGLLALFALLCCEAQAGTFVTGRCSSGEIATTAELMGVKTALEGAIAQSSESIAKVIQKTSAEEQKRQEYNTTTLVEALKQVAVLEKADRLRTGMTGPTAQPSTLCEQPEMAAAMQNGRRAARGVSKKVAEVMQERAAGVVDPLDAQRMFNEPWAQKTDAQTLYAITMSEEELENAIKLTTALSNPNPLPQKPSSKLDTAELKRAEALRNMDMMRRSLSTTIYQDIIAWRSPTNQNGDLLKTMAQNAGVQVEPTDIVDGMASMAAYWDYVILSRTGNPNWYSELATRSESALMREQVMIAAQQLEMQIKTHDLLQKTSGLLANMHSINVDQDRINNGYAR